MRLSMRRGNAPSSAFCEDFVPSARWFRRHLSALPFHLKLDGPNIRVRLIRQRFPCFDRSSDTRRRSKTVTALFRRYIGLDRDAAYL